MSMIAVAGALFCCAVGSSAPAKRAPGERPNIVIVYIDDLGYADVGCFGAKRWKTPHIDRLAAEGIRLTSFYVAEPVCSASRTGLLTGCYPTRLGIHGALSARSNHGIADSELTLAELVKQKGYATAIYGKWHLGHHPPFLPTRHGFDEYFGLPYSNDMWPHHPEPGNNRHPPLPLIENDKIVNPDVTSAEQSHLTRWYTERAVRFIERHKAEPFFLYVPHTMVHVPLHVGDRFRGSSGSGVYGDIVQEVDWSVGEICAALKRNGIEENTLVIFASDNGPWLSYGNHGGSAEPLREGKGTVFEGGVRVPFVARWPGHIPAGAVCNEPAMTIDLLPTIANQIGARLPDHKIDGLDIWPLLSAQPGAKSPHSAYFFYYQQNELQALRSGKWKLMLPHGSRTMRGQKNGSDGKPGKYAMEQIGLELYDLEADLGESRNVAAAHPDVVKKLLAMAETARADLGDKLTNRKGAGSRPPGQFRKP